MRDEAERFFSEIIGKNCWAVIAGPGTGSVINLYFGEKRRRARALTNPHLTPDERAFEGEKGVVVYSSWRLESTGEILSTSQNVGPDGIDLNQLLRVKGSVVDSIEFVSSLHDLRVGFSSGIALAVFCDIATGMEDDSNYVLFNETTSVAVTPTGRLAVERR